MITVLSVAFASSDPLADGLDQRAAGDWAAAAQTFDAAVASGRDEYPLWMELAVTRSWLGDFDAALTAYDHALALAPTSTAAQVGRARVLFWDGHPGRARDALSPVLEAVPHDPEGLELAAALRADRPTTLTARTGAALTDGAPTPLLGVSVAQRAGLARLRASLDTTAAPDPAWRTAGQRGEVVVGLHPDRLWVGVGAVGYGGDPLRVLGLVEGELDLGAFGPSAGVQLGADVGVARAGLRVGRTPWVQAQVFHTRSAIVAPSTAFAGSAGLTTHGWTARVDGSVSVGGSGRSWAGGLGVDRAFGRTVQVGLRVDGFTGTFDRTSGAVVWTLTP